MRPGVTLDAGALIALERGDRRMVVLLARIAEAGGTVVVPAAALAQVIRVPARQVPLMRLLRQVSTVTEPLDRAAASFVGQLLGRTGTTDIADAHVVICARQHGHAVVTSDPQDLARLDPALDLVAI